MSASASKINTNPNIQISISPTPVITGLMSKGIRISPTLLPTLPQKVVRTVRLGIALDDYSNKNNGLTAAENMLNKQLSSISIYKQFGNSGNKELNSDDLAYIKQKNYTLIIAWEPWNPQEGQSQSVDYLQSIISGGQDDYIKQFASRIKEYNQPVIIRFGHEMNGNWYPWGNKPDEYTKAYKYIVNLFRQENISNVSWMWSINADNVPYEPIAGAIKYYPGNDYVDVVGIDGFNFGGSRGWRSFRQIFIEPYNFTKQFNKPIFIAETASSEANGDKADWIVQMYRDLDSVFVQVAEIEWFNILKEEDWRIDSSKAALSAFNSFN